MRSDSKGRVVLCVAPHPDDETLGCGGTLLRHIAEGDAVHWLIATGISEEKGFPAVRVESREQEIQRVGELYGFVGIHRLDFPAAELDTLPRSKMVTAMSAVMDRVAPEVVYVPYRNDVHSDHAVVFDAVISCTKNFRRPSVKAIYAYETLSETEFGLRPDDPGFRPNLFVDTTQWLDQRISIMTEFAGEMGSFPFPRSKECLRAQAALRGSQAGVRSAEAFMLLKEIR